MPDFIFAVMTLYDFGGSNCHLISEILLVTFFHYLLLGKETLALEAAESSYLELEQLMTGLGWGTCMFSPWARNRAFKHNVGIHWIPVRVWMITLSSTDSTTTNLCYLVIWACDKSLTCFIFFLLSTFYQ